MYSNFSILILIAKKIQGNKLSFSRRKVLYYKAQKSSTQVKERQIEFKTSKSFLRFYILNQTFSDSLKKKNTYGILNAKYSWNHKERILEHPIVVKICDKQFLNTTPLHIIKSQNLLTSCSGSTFLDLDCFIVLITSSVI